VVVSVVVLLSPGLFVSSCLVSSRVIKGTWDPVVQTPSRLAQEEHLLAGRERPLSRILLGAESRYSMSPAHAAFSDAAMPSIDSDELTARMRLIIVPQKQRRICLFFARWFQHSATRDAAMTPLRPFTPFSQSIEPYHQPL
jgi:hypothetical protein